MSQINQNIDYNNYNYAPNRHGQVPMPSQPKIKIPDYYVQNEERKSFSDMMEENPFWSLPYEMIIKPFVEHPLTIIGSWLGACVALDAYRDACGGKYKGSLLQKIANTGDKIEESKFVQNKPVQTVLNGIKSLKKGGGRVVQNSAILRGMRDTPTMPEWPMARTQMFNQKQEVVQDFIKIADSYHLDSDGYYCEGTKGHTIGANKLEKELAQKAGIPAEKVDSYILLKRLGKDEKEINKILAAEDFVRATKDEILKEMGLKKEQIKLIKEDQYGKYIKDVEEATKKVSGRVRIGAGHFGWLGPITKPFERTIGCDEIYNKLHSMGDGAKTATGRFMSKMTQMIHRGLTFGGGKVGILLFIAPLLVEAAINTKKADKNEKVGTLANNLVESVSWVFTFPLALRMMHTLGGAQNAGMSKENVEKCREILDTVNKKNKAGEYATKAEHDKAVRLAKAQIKELETVKGQNFLTKGVRKFFRFINWDLGRFDGYNTGNMVTSSFYKMKNLPRNIVGIPMRFGIWGLLSMGLLGGALTKATTAIFGRPYDAMKEDEIKANKKEQKNYTKEDLQERMIAIQTAKMQQQMPIIKKQAVSNQQNVAHRGREEGVNFEAMPVQQYEKTPIDNYTYIPSQKNVIPSDKKNIRDNYHYIPSQNNKIKTNTSKDSNKRSYIPSQRAANIQKTWDNSGMESVLAKADQAEAKAIRILAGNFDGM